MDVRGREGDYVWIGLHLHGRIDGRGFDRTKFTWIGVNLQNVHIHIYTYTHARARTHTHTSIHNTHTYTYTHAYTLN